MIPSHRLAGETTSGDTEDVGRERLGRPKLAPLPIPNTRRFIEEVRAAQLLPPRGPSPIAASFLLHGLGRTSPAGAAG